jgi:hypothetical protein
MSKRILQKRGERKVKLRIKNPLDISSIEVIDVESGQTLDGVTEVELPHFESGRLYGARVTLTITDIEAAPIELHDQA